MAKRHFPYQHPTFGTKKNPKTISHWKVSVYYWWYEYLKRNEDYKKTCLKQGKGKCSKIYEHFGDVFEIEFKQWWTESDRGAFLFAEPLSPTIKHLTDQLVDTSISESKNRLVLEVPLNLPINFLVRNFRDVISKHHTGKRGKRNNQTTKAMYQVKGKVDVAFLETALMVWDLKQADSKKPLWKIAQELGLGGKNRILKDDTDAEITNKKNILAATVSRYYRKANMMIKKSVEGTFPH